MNLVAETSLFEANVKAQNMDLNQAKLIDLLKDLSESKNKNKISQFIDLSSITTKIDGILPTVNIVSYMDVTGDIASINPHWNQMILVHRCLGSLVNQESEYGQLGQVLIESEEDCYDEMNQCPFYMTVVRNVGCEVEFGIIDLLENDYDYEQAYRYMSEIFAYSEIKKMSQEHSLEEESKYRFMLNEALDCFKVSREIPLCFETLALSQCMEFFNKKAMEEYVEGILGNNNRMENIITIELKDTVINAHVSGGQLKKWRNESPSMNSNAIINWK